ncbi:MAG: DUF3530 family protein [Pseudomonadota bacterium]
MNVPIQPFLILLLALGLSPLAAQEASEDEQAPSRPEHTPAQQSRFEALQAMPLKGEKLSLNVADEPIFALYQAQSRGSGRGSVLLLHDRGSHPAAPGVIEPLRLGLPQAGWSSLSLSLPPLAEDGLTIEWLERSRERIAAAVEALAQRSQPPVVLIGHGSGARAAVDYLAGGEPPDVRGLVMIGMPAPANTDEPRLDSAEQLAGLTLPMLDIAGSRDTPGVLQSAERREQAAIRQQGEREGSAHTRYRDIADRYTPRQGRSVNYRQLLIPGANHNFDNQSDTLTRRIRGWLQRHIADE